MGVIIAITAYFHDGEESDFRHARREQFKGAKRMDRAMELESPAGRLPRDYPAFLSGLKERIRAARVKAVLAVNREMVSLYWDLGRDVAERVRRGRWGTGIIKRISLDVQTEFPGIRGFSRPNIQRMRAFYRAWTADSICSQAVSKLDRTTVPQPLGELPWGHNIVLIESLESSQERLWYARQALQHGWSRPVLVHQIESGLHLRQGKALTNFARTLPPAQSDLAQEALKDDYALDFLRTAGTKERDIEHGLVADVQRCLLELGAGFAFVGRQHHLEIGGEDFYIDLLFYHLKLRCFVVIELKTGPFKPEHAGKMSFYLAAADDLLRHHHDQPSIGIILCKSKNKIIAEYALRDMNKPIGVSSYQLTKALPNALEGRLPTTKELEEKLRRQA
ncbi:MAG: YhcG family protein [Elusimicrobiota bacterium]